MALASTPSSLEAFRDIPVIDLSALSKADSEQRLALALDVRDACSRVGFFYVKNHGIPENVILRALDASKEFFDLPLESKMEIENKKSANLMGYSPLLSGNNDPNNEGDLQEGFEFGWEMPDTERSSEDHDPSVPSSTTNEIMEWGNVWPRDLPTFRKESLKYYHAAVNLGRLLFPLFALALDLPENFFSDKTQHSAALMRFLHYPPQAETTNKRVLGIGAHTDWECFMILWQQPNLQALEVLNPNGEWIDAPPIPGTLVINLGDQFARWTNDVFKSTVHRAINRSGVRRYSFPLFFGTDYNVILEPIPGCVTPDRPARYTPITAGEYVKSRLAATYGH